MPPVLFFIEYLDASRVNALGVVAVRAIKGCYHNVLTNEMISQNYLDCWCEQVSESAARQADPQLFAYTLDTMMKGVKE